MPVGPSPKRLHKSNPHRLQHPPATPSCQDFALPNGIEDLLGERGDLLTTLQVRSLEPTKSASSVNGAGEGQRIACIRSIDYLMARHFPIIRS